MKRVLAFTGSPRTHGNSTYLLKSFLYGAKKNTDRLETINPYALDLEYCRGCLRCNVLRRCSIREDDWAELSRKILDSDILVFAAPVYFHHLPAPLKKVIDRFRSFVHVKISETGLIHTPWEEWNKDFVLLLSMGSPNASEAQPVTDLFQFMTSILGDGNRLHLITAGRLALEKQIIKSREELENVYLRLDLRDGLAAVDSSLNNQVLQECSRLASDLTSPNLPGMVK